MTQQHQIPHIEEPTPKRKPRLNVYLAAGVALLAAGLGVGGTIYATRDTQPPAPQRVETITIQGDITVPSSLGSQGFKGGDCVSDDGYTDIAIGSQVTITNQAGVVIHTGTLGNGHTSDTVPDLNGGDPIPFKCTYHFLIEGVPGDATNYGVAVGNTFRGIVHYTREQVDGFIHLNLG